MEILERLPERRQVPDERSSELPPTSELIVADMAAGARGLLEEINREHELAQAAKDTAVEHAIRAGQLLLEQKARLAHGDFQPWIEANCRFAYSTASRYMRAARRISQGVEISSLTGLFPSGRKTERAPKTLPPPAPSAAEIPVEASPASAELTIDRATEVLRRQKNDKQGTRLLREYRDAKRALERAQIAHNNAVASLLAAARKIEEAQA